MKSTAKFRHMVRVALEELSNTPPPDDAIPQGTGVGAVSLSKPVEKKKSPVCAPGPKAGSLGKAAATPSVTITGSFSKGMSSNYDYSLDIELAYVGVEDKEEVEDNVAWNPWDSTGDGGFGCDDDDPQECIRQLSRLVTELEEQGLEVINKVDLSVPEESMHSAPKVDESSGKPAGSEGSANPPKGLPPEDAPLWAKAVERAGEGAPYVKILSIYKAYKKKQTSDPDYAKYLELKKKFGSKTAAQGVQEKVSALIDSFMQEFAEYRDLRDLTTQWNSHADAKHYSALLRVKGARELCSRGLKCEARVNSALAAVPTYGEVVAVDGQLIPRAGLESLKGEEEIFDDKGN